MTTGSSPLARGLPRYSAMMHTFAGIIPARAGFTSRRSAMWAWARGSSPLARGLHGQVVLPLFFVRIIPARAGFTPHRRPSPWWRRDHPRSRGVYRTRRCCPPSVAGSSPLARGLHDARQARDADAGIIPARAGFTTSAVDRAIYGEDHPRSRGVYGAPGRPRSSPSGSSPLARGLPGSSTCTGFRQSDHPRSRGVYAGPSTRPQPRAGSSPLARGLHHGGSATVVERRIIPARAGFTRRVSMPKAPPAGSSPLARGLRGRVLARCDLLGDHPRSRGVYHGNALHLFGLEGSSPLARGLPSIIARPPPSRRIIPARAGFTQDLAARRLGRPDRPRSRGVYSSAVKPAAASIGSSPLARGLPIRT